MATGCYETTFLLFANPRGAGTQSTAKCSAPGTHRATDARGLPGGGMLVVGIDSHIMREVALAASQDLAQNWWRAFLLLALLADPVNAITRKKLSPVRRDPGIALP